MSEPNQPSRGWPLPRFTGLPALLIGLALLSAPPMRADTVSNSVHNLAAGGPGSIKSTATTNPCIFCHTVHQAIGETPIWNHTLSSVSSYVVYGSSRLDTLGITVPQPSGSSRLCLSCHDGTVALGSISSSGTPLAVTQSGAPITTMPTTSTSNLGTDLSSDHPVSVNYDTAVSLDNQLKARPLTNSAVKLEQVGGAYYVQCTSCHNPHDNQFGNFLVMDNTGSALCITCHQQDESGVSSHAISPAALPAPLRAELVARASTRIARSVPTTMAAAGCAACHSNHNARAKAQLMQSSSPEQNCLVCHDGLTVKKNVAADFRKNSIHPITVNSSAHSPNEDPVNPRVRHVVCADCHNPHAATATAAVAPNAPGALANLTGVSDAGGIVKPLQREYELCFRCHADSVARGPATVSRQFPETNTRLQFAASNQSFHPVERAGRNTANVPSLIAPWTVNSVLYCTDCHNSDTGPGAGGSGANGPHGSAFAPILERNLAFADNLPENTSTYALCYKCHDRSRVLGNLSFRYHNTHVVQDKASCTTCHDSHGVANAPHLINFNTLYVTPGSTGIISYISTGPGSGNCTLSCHGHDHQNTRY